MYTYSDAWFLTTLILIKDWASLQQIIAGGDMINHAIFTADEVNNALSIFITLEYVQLNNDKQMCATEKAYSLCNNTFQKAGLFNKADKVFEILKITPYFEPVKTTVYFTDDETQQAYKKYVNKLKV